MKCIDILVVDDEDVEHLFNEIEGITVKTCTPRDFENDMKIIRQSKFDAVIMDQKLTGPRRSISYQGTTLIQEMRNRMVNSRDGLSPKPVVLWSVARNIINYHNERSSHNLTDAVWRKDVFGSDKEYAKSCIEQLIDLVKGYKVLNGINSNSPTSNYLTSTFGLDNEDVSLIPHQFAVFFDNKRNRKPHLISQFVLNSALRFNGPLINYSTVLARLGLSESSKDLNKIEKKIKSFRYKGIYSASNPRWWAHLIEDWWINKVDSRFPSSMPATERVKILKAKFKLDLSAASIPEGHTSDYFWHSCPFTNAPLDSLDSFKIIFPEKREWQDDIYISYSAAVARKHKEEGYSLDPLDKKKLIKKVRT